MWSGAVRGSQERSGVVRSAHFKGERKSGRFLFMIYRQQQQNGPERARNRAESF